MNVGDIIRTEDGRLREVVELGENPFYIKVEDPPGEPMWIDTKLNKVFIIKNEQENQSYKMSDDINYLIENVEKELTDDLQVVSERRDKWRDKAEKLEHRLERVRMVLNGAIAGCFAILDEK